MTTVSVGGRFLRVADVDWDDPLDAGYSMRVGGRWNEPGTFAVLYLNESVGAARANVARLLADQEELGITIDMLDPETLPLLVEVDVPQGDALDLTSTSGLTQEGLPETYPFAADGSVVEHKDCRPVGTRAHRARLAGIYAPSAAPVATPEDRELAWFPANSAAPVEPIASHRFADWY